MGIIEINLVLPNDPMPCQAGDVRPTLTEARGWNWLYEITESCAVVSSSAGGAVSGINNSDPE